MEPRQVMEMVLAQTGGDLQPWEKTYLEYHAKRYAHTLALLGPGQGQRLLDVGSFPGHLALAAQALGFAVTALTGPAENPAGLAMFQRRLERAGIALFFCDVERQDFPFAGQSFDLVLAAEIIEHLPFNPYHLLREAYRVLEPGGRVLVSTPNLNRLQALLAMAADSSPWPNLAGRFSESFHSDLTSRHVREYSGPEILYLLTRQNKELYRFHQARLSYSTCLDPPFRWPRLPAWVLEQLWPRLRSNQMVTATRPASSRLIAPEEIAPARGLHEVERQPESGQGVARALTTPFRWTGSQAQLGLPASSAAFQVFTLHLADLKPETLPAGIWRLKVGGRELPSLALAPDRAFTPLRLALPRELAQGGEHGERFLLTLDGPAWTPAEHQGEHYWEYDQTDPRALGLVLGWDGLLREDCADRAALGRLAGELLGLEGFALAPPRWGQAPGLDQRWASRGGLYLLQARLGPACVMGWGDWRHLGAGWYQREQWPTGPVRWSAGRAEAFLGLPRGAGARSLTLRLRVNAGHPALGPEVRGSLAWSWSADRLTFAPPGAATPFVLPAFTWTDLVAQVSPPPSAEAVLRVVIQVDHPRSPAQHLQGSNDHRPLGLALAGLALTA